MTISEKRRKLEEQLQQLNEKEKQEQAFNDKIFDRMNDIFYACLANYLECKSLSIRQSLRRVAKLIQKEFNILGKETEEQMLKDFTSFAKNTITELYTNEDISIKGDNE